MNLLGNLHHYHVWDPLQFHVNS
uniref:Uncharacterized protein n=1 Tax=Anguilla anguilla TaxID=7936 RepID=A0A0E9P8R4_ANGAN